MSRSLSLLGLAAVLALPVAACATPEAPTVDHRPLATSPAAIAGPFQQEVRRLYGVTHPLCGQNIDIAQSRAAADAFRQSLEGGPFAALYDEAARAEAARLATVMARCRLIPEAERPAVAQANLQETQGIVARLRVMVEQGRTAGGARPEN